MSPKILSFAAGVFLIGIVLSFIMGGVWLDSSTKSIFGSLTAFKTYGLLGFNVPWFNLDFFTVGLPKLLSMDFAFFGGSFAFFKYAMYVFSIGIVWGLMSTFIYLISGFLKR